ncbi:hypothetical protein [Phormidium tenue]|uniref:hypothetical protein n=1 Tax=Phormidium tenue TaxID=126344 RepID=UPI0011154591|nr:hypothetical protein [Phormidium tenue]MBD2231726.1 hypothetical protein [Phormidium tenue FACHB-1052]
MSYPQFRENVWVLAIARIIRTFSIRLQRSRRTVVLHQFEWVTVGILAQWRSPYFQRAAHGATIEPSYKNRDFALGGDEINLEMMGDRRLRPAA